MAEQCILIDAYSAVDIIPGILNMIGIFAWVASTHQKAYRVMVWSGHDMLKLSNCSVLVQEMQADCHLMTQTLCRWQVQSHCQQSGHREAESSATGSWQQHVGSCSPRDR